MNFIHKSVPYFILVGIFFLSEMSRSSSPNLIPAELRSNESIQSFVNSFFISFDKRPQDIRDNFQKNLQLHRDEFRKKQRSLEQAFMKEESNDIKRFRERQKKESLNENDYFDKLFKNKNHFFKSLKDQSELFEEKMRLAQNLFQVKLDEYISLFQEHEDKRRSKDRLNQRLERSDPKNLMKEINTYPIEQHQFIKDLYELDSAPKRSLESD